MIKFSGASKNLVHHLSRPPALETAVDLVMEADRALGRAPFSLSKTQIVRIPPPPCGGPAYCCIFPPNREDRPFNSDQEGSAAAAPDGGSNEDPLSLDAVQQAGQSYFALSSGSLHLLLLSNPWGYAERCVTWPAIADIEQAEAGCEAVPWAELLEALLLLCAALNGDMVAFNGVGNSQKRLHFVSHRPPHAVGPYALQQAAAERSGAARRPVLQIGRSGEYPVDAWRFGFEQRRDSAAAAAELIERWYSAGGRFATVTLAAALEEGMPVLYVIPRNRLLSPFGWPGMPAAMEVMGAGVSSKTEFVNRVRGGDWGHENYRRFLGSLRPHGVERLY